MSEADHEQTASAPQAAPPPGSVWDARAEELRRQEWEAAQKLLEASRALLRRLLYSQQQQASLSELTRMLDLASKLGRLATGLATSHTELSGPAAGPIHLEFERALLKVYGPDAVARAAKPDPVPQAPQQ